jgi:predicted SAM-dependent methyltransferase
MSMKLHLGCGTKTLPGYLNIDIHPHPGVDHIGRVDRLSHIRTKSVSVVYASHVLEHFGRHEYHQVLAEWYRVLVPGGLLRIGVPDFEAVVGEYALGRLANGIDDVLGLCVGGQRDEYDFHKMIFDENSLAGALRSAGFTDVRRWDWRTTEHAHVDDYTQAYLPHMDKDHGQLMSLNLEAVKQWR